MIEAGISVDGASVVGDCVGAFVVGEDVGDFVGAFVVGAGVVIAVAGVVVGAGVFTIQLRKHVLTLNRFL